MYLKFFFAFLLLFFVSLFPLRLSIANILHCTKRHKRKPKQANGDYFSKVDTAATLRRTCQILALYFRQITLICQMQIFISR